MKPVSARRRDGLAAATLALRASAALWYLALVVGLWVFGYYIVTLYGVSALRGEWTRWNTVLPAGHGYNPGDLGGNAVLGVHLLAAGLVSFSGALQLVPQIRSRVPALHRWNGRLFLLIALMISGSGLYVAFTRGAVAGHYMAVGNTLNAVLVIVCAVLAWRHAAARRIALHQRWALRLFVLMYGVWFYRVGMMLWFVIHKAPVGHNDTFTGPFDIFLAFAHVLLPLAVLEVYMLARDRGGALAKSGMALALFVLTLAMSVGIFGATMGMWLPRL